MSNQLFEFRVSEDNPAPEWDRFVADTEGGHHVQTSLWATLKASQGWKTLRLSVWRYGSIVAGAQVLVNKYPIIGSVGYVPKAPLCAIKDVDLVIKIIEWLRLTSLERKLTMLAVQPPNNAAPISALLLNDGFHSSSLELGPVASILLDLSPDLDNILSRTKRQTRQNINRSIREGITIHECLDEELGFFYRLYLATAKRQNFRPYKREYFELMRDIMAPNGYFQIIFAKYRDEIISALLLAPFRDTVVAKILGWSGRYKEMRPNEAVFWGAILWAKDRGYRFFDFEGIDKEGARQVLRGEELPEKIRHSPDHLKYGFSGQVVIYPETYEFIPRRLYRRLISVLKPEVAQQSIASKVLDLMRKL